MSVYLFVTLDTKGIEADFVRARLRELGVDVVLVDVGCLGEPQATAEVSRDEVFRAAGSSLVEMRTKADRGVAVMTAAAGAAAIAAREYAAGRLSAVVGLGGSAGSTIASAAMRALPLGVPKVLVSTLASGNTRPYVGDKDVLLLNAVVDIAGLNRISRTVLDEAARAVAGLVKFPAAARSSDDRPLIAASMFGVTTPCVQRARQELEAAGYEVLTFHAVGSGGQAMESLIDDGLIAGVLDITTTELADELVGGVLSAGPNRLTSAGRRGVPQVVSVGACDMVNFHAPETVPPQFAQRTFYRHNPNVTLMRTTAAECAKLGQEIGRKAAAACGPTAIVLPGQGVSAIDRTGQPFDNPRARRALFDAIRTAAPTVETIELDAHINDETFAVAAAKKLLQLMTVHQPA
jgi:uncharacterized protein (UPF0261 family)